MASSIDLGVPRRDQTLADRVTELLVGEIRDGRWPVRSRLPTERAMTAHYGVSRTVVREAISRLKSEGLVETRQGSGTMICDPTASDAFRLAAVDGHPARGVLRILELRRGIETEMAALAAERRTGAEMTRIRRALKAITTAVARGGDGVEEDLAFHIAISQAAHNTHYTELLGMLTRALQDAIRVTRRNEARHAELAQQVRREHDDLAAAIDARDAAAARTAAFLHMRQTATRIERADGDFWTGDSRLAARRLASTPLGDVLRTSPSFARPSSSIAKGSDLRRTTKEAAPTGTTRPVPTKAR